MADLLTRMVAFRIDDGVDGPITVARTFAGGIAISQEGGADGLRSIMLSDEAAALAVIALGDILADSPAPQRRPRIDIAEGIVEFLRGGPHSIKELAAGIERKPSQIQSAIVRLMNAGRVEDMADGTYRVAVRAEAAQ